MKEEPGLGRRLAAILHADVQGYSRLMGEAVGSGLRTFTPRRARYAGLFTLWRDGRNCG
jgi:hypothetical protein